METVKYIRVSTKDQNIDRQETDKHKQYVDVCSGKIAFKDRKEGKKLYNLAASGKIKTIKVHSIDRFGRDTLNILNTIQEFTDMGVCIESEKEAIKTCDNEGKQTPTARLLLSVMATLAQFEIEQKKERQMEGIARKQATGFYKLNAGRSKESSTDFINKDKNQRILKMLEKGAGIREIERTLRGRGESASKDTIRKVKSIAEELDLLKRAKSNEEKLKEYFKEPTNYKDIFELHKGMKNCEMTLTELKREFNIHKVEYQRMNKKGAEETWQIDKVIRFFDGSSDFGGYGKREEAYQLYIDRSDIAENKEFWVKQLKEKIKDDEKMIQIPYYKHLHENR
ncbi:recombinase family protein [Flavobacteriaceae bacterium]|nr:recombinase family protein [Flavobacteriaceae bacterium]